jgi:hypothetical protein
MTPLNLTLAPPRSPRAELDGVIFLARSIDKVRATLPGGDPGAYRVAGLTQTMLDVLRIELDAFTRAVGAAAGDDDVVAFVREHAAPGTIGRWNELVARREPREGNRAEALGIYPWLAGRPDMLLVLDVLEEDDRLSFASAS